MRIIFAFSLVFVGLSAHAFNKDRCGTLFPKGDGDHPPYYAPLYVSTMFPSTTSYFSSIGPCAMYGDAVARNSFLEKSLGPLKVDAARGQGEFLNAMAELSGCPANQHAEFAHAMQQNFGAIFLQPTEQILMHIDQVMSQTPTLSASCASL